MEIWIIEVLLYIRMCLNRLIFNNQIRLHILWCNIIFKPGMYLVSLMYFVGLCTYAYPPPRLIIISDVMWHDMDPIWLVR